MILLNKMEIDVLQNKKVLTWWDYPIFIVLSILSLAAIFHFLYYWFSLNDLFTFPIFYSILTTILIVILINNQGRWFLLLFMRKPKPMLIKSDWRVAAITSIVPHAESNEMLEITLKALIALDYPHDTWVLDEEDDDTVKKLCTSLGANHFSRKNAAQYQADSGIFQSGSKHGNYNAWLYSIGFERYDVIAAFDPDHIPNPNFLSRVLGYFEDPAIGYVQAAQAYYNQKASFIARGAAEETYAYYSSLQMASYGMGYPIVVGCHNTHRVTALKQVGGLAPHDADDLLITMLYRDQGWKGVYVPEILARGLTPVDWSGYLTQQRRWARSVLDAKFRCYPKIANNLTFKTRLISFLHGLNYLHRSIVICIALILLLDVLCSGRSPAVFSFETMIRLAILGAALQMAEFYRQRFYLDRRQEWGLHWRVGVLHLAKWPGTLLAFFEAIINRKIPYQMTRKIKMKAGRFNLFWHHLVVLMLIGAAVVMSIASNDSLHPTIYFCAAILALGSLVPILTSFKNFPHPFDKALLKKSYFLTIATTSLIVGF